MASKPAVRAETVQDVDIYGFTGYDIKRYSLSYLCFLCDLASVCRVTVGQSGLAGALVTGESRESQLSVFSARDNKSL